MFVGRSVRSVAKYLLRSHSVVTTQLKNLNSMQLQVCLNNLIRFCNFVKFMKRIWRHDQYSNRVIKPEFQGRYGLLNMDL